MGCELQKNNYADGGDHCHLETEIRQWEIRLGTFDKILMDIITKINAKLLIDSHNIPKENLISFFNLEIKENSFKNIMNQDILKIGSQKDAEFDPDMIKLLFFLLTRTNLSKNKTNSLSPNLTVTPTWCTKIVKSV